ncbi:MAG: class I SAM-dependent methyltransferase [Bacteroidales bacterium]|nr:class I SAM-dependent methyltransferase [Bacteroidales bacterium]
MRYTFGHTNTAADRLRQIAEFFDPHSEEFIREHVLFPVNRSADLGCGPGFTTAMLARACQPAELVGFDLSSYFLDLARTEFPGYDFQQHDVTLLEDPFGFDLMYCRFLLSHLRHHKEMIRKWISCLRPGGCLILDELEDVLTDVSVFRNYLQISSSLVKSQGAELYVGKLLENAVKGFNIRIYQTDTLPVEDRLAATWFFGNTIGPWKEEKYILDNVPGEKAKQLSDKLFSIFTESKEQSNITWKMKRIILTR